MANTNGYVSTDPVEKKKTLALPKTTAPVEQVKNPAQQGDAQLPVQQPGGNAQPMSAAAPANATTNPASTAKYTTLNDQIWGADGAGLKGYEQQLETQRQNGGAATAYEDEAFRQQLIAAGIDPAKLNWYTQNGGYTQNREDAIAKGGTGEAAENFYEEGTWYYYPKTEREVQAGTSGADEAHLSDASYAYIQYCKEMYAKATTPEDKAYWHNEAEKTRARAGYSGGADGSMYIPLAQLKSESGSGSVDGENTAGDTTEDAVGDTTEERLQGLLDAWKQAAEEQTKLSVDYAVEKAVKEYERILEDARPQFKEQAESVSLEERQAMDNAALYAELRGDKGGIGREQYSSIRNTAAQNRLAVQQAQTKLSTDTARRIEDLRVQGEFDKADAVFEIAQEYLSQLISLEQWAAQHDLSVEQFHANLKQWAAEYELTLKQLEIDREQWAAEHALDWEKLGISQEQWAAEHALDWEKLGISQEQWAAEHALDWEKLGISQEQWAAEHALDWEKLGISQEQWAAEHALDWEKLGISKEQWAAELGFKETQLDYEKYLDSMSILQTKQKELTETGWVILNMGILPEQKYLDAMELDSATAEKMIELLGWENGLPTEDEGKNGPSPLEIYEMLYTAGYTPDDRESILAYLINGGMEADDARVYYNAYASREYDELRHRSYDWGPGFDTVRRQGQENSDWDVFYAMIESRLRNENHAGVKTVMEEYGWKLSKEQYLVIRDLFETYDFDGYDLPGG